MVEAVQRVHSEGSKRKRRNEKRERNRYLEIAVDDAERVKVGNGREELLHDNGRLELLVLLALYNALKQLAAGDTKQRKSRFDNKARRKEAVSGAEPKGGVTHSSMTR